MSPVTVNLLNLSALHFVLNMSLLSEYLCSTIKTPKAICSVCCKKLGLVPTPGLAFKRFFFFQNNTVHPASVMCFLSESLSCLQRHLQVVKNKVFLPRAYKTLRRQKTTKDLIDNDIKISLNVFFISYSKCKCCYMVECIWQGVWSCLLLYIWAAGSFIHSKKEMHASCFEY